ncbi:MAG TPA: DUF2927 domain-containing protein [Xanthobacteraceae bacterium]|nr:DUF2927 domain-containing protein [Xanthobacteraceae bacterium]
MPPAVMRRIGLLALAIGVTSIGLASAQHPEIDRRRAADRKSFSDREIALGFFKVAFGAELGLAGRVDRIRKYEQPVRVFISGPASPPARTAVERVVGDIRRHVAHLDIAMTRDSAAANFLVRLVPDRDLEATVRRLYGANGRRIVRSLEPQCLSGIRKDAHYRIVSSDVILVSDAAPPVFYDCAYEELLQALGPIRDDPTVPWTMFNDNVQKGFFDVYDQYILNILYHPRVRAGMTRTQVRRLLPQIMPDVRAHVAKTNGFAP